MLEATPWARTALDDRPTLVAAVQAAEPADYMVRFGRGSGGWTCRILRPDMSLAAEEFYAGTITSAWTRALDRLEPEQADGMTQAKARDDLRDGVAHFEWHGHDIEVEVS